MEIKLFLQTFFLFFVLQFCLVNQGKAQIHQDDIILRFSAGQDEINLEVHRVDPNGSNATEPVFFDFRITDDQGVEVLNQAGLVPGRYQIQTTVAMPGRIYIILDFGVFRIIQQIDRNPVSA